jgi:hypothetical protein
MHDIYRLALLLACCVLAFAWMIPARLSPIRTASPTARTPAEAD